LILAQSFQWEKVAMVVYIDVHVHNVL